MRAMKMRKTIVIVMALMFLVAVMGCQTGSEKADSAISTEITAKIASEPAVADLNIDVNTLQGNVTLSGTVPSKEAESQLIDLAKETKGVKSVKSNLKIQK
jgi:hyperosmotically inducible protein